MSTFAFLSTPDIMIILVIALIVFGPQKLPEIGRQIGAAMRELRKVSGEVQRALDIDDVGGHSYNGYDSGRWFDPAPVVTAMAPAGTVAAHADPLAIESAGSAPHAEAVHIVADPPGPPARRQAARQSEGEESGQHEQAAGTERA